MTFQHRAGVSSYTSACALAETCVFGKQLLGPLHCDLHCCRLPFSRSYGVILPSSLTRVLPFVLHYSYHLPVSVCGTGTLYLLSRFSRQCEFTYFITKFHSPSSPSLRIGCTSLPNKPHDLAAHFHPCGYAILLCPCFALNQYTVVLEYLPVVHHLRRSPSA